MRGKAVPDTVVSVLVGITPAYAGKSPCRVSREGGKEDHPRVCGEKNAPNCLTICMMGSPPRMRGKGQYTSGTQDCKRITPAYAGKRTPANRTTDTRRDHPRVCGEKAPPSSVKITETGSPPRMRGKVAKLHMSVKTRRITPAYAGKRNRRSEALRNVGDHPRVCGEKTPISRQLKAAMGSPPRMRGKGPRAPRRP